MRPISMFRVVWLTSVLASCSGEVAAPMQADPASKVAVEKEGWGSASASAGGAWTYRAMGPAPGPDYALSFDLRIDDPSDNDLPVHQGAQFTYYNNNEDLGGYEAGAVVRRGGDGSMYRFMFSARWQEALLWSSRGGILQVRPFPFVARRTYRIKAAALGRHLELSVDGQPVLSVWDQTVPLLSGEAALGRKEGTTWFGAATLEGLAPTQEGPPPHVARLSIRNWKGLRWGFDGDEPIFAIGLPTAVAQTFLPRKSECMAYEVKLVPGYAAQLFIPWYMQNWAQGLNLGALSALDVTEQGERLSFTLACGSDGDRQDLVMRTTVTVSYDAQSKAYRYDHQSDLGVPPGSTLQVDYPFDLVDPGLFGGVPSSSTQGLQWPEPHPWSVYQQLSGNLYKEPHNHMSWYPGYGLPAWYAAQMDHMKPDGGFWTLVGDPIANPVFQLQEPAGRKEFLGLMCNWGYDLHLSWVPGDAYGTVVQPGTYSFHWNLTSVDGGRGQDLLKKARFAVPTDLSATWLLYTGGVGHVEHFDKVVPRASPFGEYVWGDGALQDGKIGHTDHTSLRLSGPRFAMSITGGSQFAESFLPDTDYEVSVWVKTQDVVGEGPGIVFGDKVYYPGTTGTTSWQRMGMVVRPGTDLSAVAFGLHNSGSGTAWFDDFLIRPVTPDHPADSMLPHAPRPLTDVGTPITDKTLWWNEKGGIKDAAHTLLDLSGHGHHATLEGAKWVDEQGVQVLQFGGLSLSSHVLMRGHPSVNLGDQASLSLWFKPDQTLQVPSTLLGGGTDDEDEWRVQLFPGETSYNVDIQAAGRLITTEDDSMQPGQWSHLLLSHDGQDLRVWVNGRLIKDEALPGTWLGKADHGYLRLGVSMAGGALDNAFSGRMSTCKVVPHAMSAAEVAAEYVAGPFAR